MNEDLGPATGEMRVVLDIAIARGWPVYWNPAATFALYGKRVKEDPYYRVLIKKRTSIRIYIGAANESRAVWRLKEALGIVERATMEIEHDYA